MILFEGIALNFLESITLKPTPIKSSPYKDRPIELGAEQKTEPVKTEETLKSLQTIEDSTDLFTSLSRGRGRPAGSKDTVQRVPNVSNNIRQFLVSHTSNIINYLQLIVIISFKLVL